MSNQRINIEGNTIINLINSAPIYVLLEIGKYVARTDYAICYYNNPKHPKFYREKEKVRKSIRRAYGIGAFDHREIIERMLYWHYIYKCKRTALEQKYIEEYEEKLIEKG